jgi:hypothetical protein
MSRPLSYSHVLSTFVAEAARDARPAKRDARPPVDAEPQEKPRTIHPARLDGPPEREERLKPAA